MKIFFLTFLTFVLLTSCSKDDNKVVVDKTFQLPPETQTGANTFGVTIRGKVYVPRDPKGVNVGGATPKGMISLVGGILPNEYNELVVVDGASSVGFKITIHIQNLGLIGAYTLKQSNFQDQADSVLLNHIFFKIWDNNINNYAYYGSVEDQGIINITRNDTVNFIRSGNFSGKFVRYDNPNEFITITDGRFDIGPVLYDKVFP
jgi:hypothetical protein